ncbi:hypothetical protein Tco_1145314 [Tanacetum coccineum]
MDDLWSIGNHDFVVEMNAHRLLSMCEEDSPISSGDSVLDCFILQVKDWGREIPTLVVTNLPSTAVGKQFCLGGMELRLPLSSVVPVLKLELEDYVESS